MLAAICLSSCMKIIDWVPVTFQIRVQDEQGKDLLDPANDNTWLLGTKIHYRGVIIDIDETNISSPATKAIPATYQGFRLEKGSDYYYLAFGEFDGGSEYDEEDMSEMVIRILRFGSYVEVLAPSEFRKAVVAKLKDQYEWN